MVFRLWGHLKEGANYVFYLLIYSTRYLEQLRRKTIKRVGTDLKLEDVTLAVAHVGAHIFHVGNHRTGSAKEDVDVIPGHGGEGVHHAFVNATLESDPGCLDVVLGLTQNQMQG